MKLSTRRTASSYLNEMIDYGGEPWSRGDAIKDMQALGLTQPQIDRWLQGSELAQSLRESQG